MLTPASVVASGGALVDLDATLFIQLGIFLLMFLLLRQLLFKPVIRLIEARRTATVGMRDAADELEAEARKLNEDVEKRLEEVSASASAEREKMVDQARGQERELLNQARDDARGVVEQSKKDAVAQAEQARQSLRGEVSALASSVAATVLGRQL